MSWSGMNPNVWWQSQELFEASNLRIWSLFLVESTFPLLITASIITQSLFSLWVESGILSEVWVQHGQIGSWFQAEKESDLETVSSMAWFGFGEGVTGLVYVWTMLVFYQQSKKKHRPHVFQQGCFNLLSVNHGRTGVGVPSSIWAVGSPGGISEGPKPNSSPGSWKFPT